MSMRVDPRHPDYTAFRDAMQAEVEATPQRIAEIRTRIADLCAPFHAFDVLFAVWSTSGVVRPGTLRPIDPDGSAATAEYIAHVLLDRASPDATREATTRQTMQGSPDPLELGRLVLDLMQRLPMWFTYRQSGSKHETDPYVELRTHLRVHRLSIRSLTYEWQERATLEQLFGPFEKELHAELGFSVSEALALTESIALLPRERARDYAGRAREFADWLKHAVREWRAGREPDVGALAERVEQFAAMPPKRAEASIDRLAMAMMASGLGQHAAFSADELAEHASVDREAADRFLETFSVDFGRRADAELWSSDIDKATGGEIEVMRARPVLRDGQGRHLAASVESVFFGLRDVLTDALKPKGKAWQRFRRRRGDLLETRAVDALDNALAAEWSYRGVKYQLVGPDGDVEEGEADGVLRAGTVVFLVEAKSGSLAPSSRRAAPDRLEKELRELVVDAHDQLERTRGALVDGLATKVTDENDTPLELDLDGITRVIRVAVTLDDLSGVAPAVWRLQDAGLLPAEERAPWLVGIHELETICDLVERPSQLVHYIARRQRANRQRIWAIDELDFFMRYLKDGLFFEDEQLGGSFLQLNNHTDPLDAYIYGERGLTPPVRRPRQKLNGATRSLLESIGRTDSIAAIEAQAMILEMSTTGRERIAGALRQLARKTKRDGLPHDLTLVFRDDFAVTVMSMPGDRIGELPHALERLGTSRIERSALGRWLGLGVDADRSALSALAVFASPSHLEKAERTLLGGSEERDSDAEPSGSPD